MFNLVVSIALLSCIIEILIVLMLLLSVCCVIEIYSSYVICLLFTCRKAYVLMQPPLTCLLGFSLLVLKRQKVVLTFLQKEEIKQMISHKIQMILLSLEVSSILQNARPNSNNIMNMLLLILTALLRKKYFIINHACFYWIFWCNNQLHVHAFFFLDSCLVTPKIVSHIYFGMSRTH